MSGGSIGKSCPSAPRNEPPPVPSGTCPMLNCEAGVKTETSSIAVLLRWYLIVRLLVMQSLYPHPGRARILSRAGLTRSHRRLPPESRQCRGGGRGRGALRESERADEIEAQTSA